MNRYSLLPERLREGVQRYIDHGVLPGDFLRAVICHDLWGAFRFADEWDLKHLAEVVEWFHDEAPCTCHGSVVWMSAWQACGGRLGKKEVMA